MMPPPSVSRLKAGGTFYRPHLLAFLDFYLFYYSQRLLKPIRKKTRYFRDPRRAPLTNLYRLLYPSFFEFLLGFLFIAPASWAANHLAKPTEHSRINFRHVCLRTGKVTCLLINWPTSWQPDLSPTTWPIFLVVDMSSCNWAVNSCCACSTA